MSPARPCAAGMRRPGRLRNHRSSGDSPDSEAAVGPRIPIKTVIDCEPMAMIVLARKVPAVKQVEKRLVTHAYFNSILRLPLGASFFQNIAGNAKIRSPRGPVHVRVKWRNAESLRTIPPGEGDHAGRVIDDEPQRRTSQHRQELNAFSRAIRRGRS